MRGEVAASIVYSTAAAVGADQVTEALCPGEETSRPVVYPEAVVTGSKQSALSHGCIELLLSPAGPAVLAPLAFQPPPHRPRRGHQGVGGDGRPGVRTVPG